MALFRPVKVPPCRYGMGFRTVMCQITSVVPSAPTRSPNTGTGFRPSCSPCPNQIPEYLKIDTESPLLGSMKPYKRHILFQVKT